MFHRKRDHDSEDDGNIITWNDPGVNATTDG
jgi:hypothetical protein